MDTTNIEFAISTERNQELLRIVTGKSLWIGSGNLNFYAGNPKWGIEKHRHFNFRTKFFFYKNVFYPAQAEDSYFSANFISKIFLLLFLSYIV